MKVVILTVFAVLAACGDSRQPEPEDTETVFDPLTEQLDEAKAVEEAVERHKREIDAVLEDAEDRDDP